MMKKYTLILGILFFVLVFSNCKKELDPVNPDNPQPVDSVASMNDLAIPESFNFETSKDIEMTISGFKNSKADGDIKYEIYLYDPAGVDLAVQSVGDDGTVTDQSGTLVDVMNNLNTTHITNDPNFVINVTLPDYYDTLYVVQNDMGYYQSQLIPITSTKMSISFPENPYKNKTQATKDDPSATLYAVNSLKEMYSINPLSGEIEILPDLPSNSGGSWTCAIDPVEEILYTFGITYPYYLYAYDINDQTWETRGTNYYQGPRLAYNVNDGMLYYSFSKYVLLVNPDNGRMVSYYVINGLHDLDGGDLCFADNGTLYISSESGLYKCEFTGGNQIDAVRLSADNLPNYPNSLTFDQNQELWWASNVFNEELNKYEGRSFIMDTVTGGFEDRWAFTNNYIHDLATMPLDEEQVPDVDSDGDGIIDFYDEYPDDGNKAYDTYTPSIYGWGTYAFEDLWPNEGDYDFNDLVLNYRFTHVYNSSDLIVETKLNFNVKNVGGSYRNGFGIELDMDESLIQNVTGTNLTQGVVTLNGKGLEAGQAKPVVILFDDAWANVNAAEELELVITYNSPIATEDFGTKNPFIFVNGDRGREVHLSNNPPTSLANPDFFGTQDDDSDPATGRYYKNANHLPWAIDIIHDFVYLQEKVPIIYGYNRFDDWAQSGGTSYTDWYKDQDGYRNNQYLVY
jgi:LruC domain-containing protein